MREYQQYFYQNMITKIESWLKDNFRKILDQIDLIDHQGNFCFRRVEGISMLFLSVLMRYLSRCIILCNWAKIRINPSAMQDSTGESCGYYLSFLFLLNL